MSPSGQYGRDGGKNLEPRELPRSLTKEEGREGGRSTRQGLAPGLLGHTVTCKGEVGGRWVMRVGGSGFSGKERLLTGLTDAPLEHLVKSLLRLEPGRSSRVRDSPPGMDIVQVQSNGHRGTAGLPVRAGS